jgi:hypothetical protein
MTTQELEARRVRYRNPRYRNPGKPREPKTWAEMFLTLAVIFLIPLVLGLIATMVLLYLQSPRVGEELVWVDPALDLLEVVTSVLLLTCTLMKIFHQIAKLIE